MTTLAPDRVAVPPPLLPALAEIVASARLEAVVATGCAAADLRDALAALGVPLWVIDVRPAVVAAARAQFAGRFGVRCEQGVPTRVLADLRCQIPARTLFVLGQTPGCASRDEVFWIRRGSGAVVVLPAAPAGVADDIAVRDQLLRWSPEHRITWHATADGGLAFVALPQPRVHVTFLIEKYTHEYGASGPSINLDNLVATLDQTGLAAWNVVHYDEWHHEGRELTASALRPTTVADTHVLACTLHYHSRANPSVALLRQARAAGSRVVFFWLDKKISQRTPAYHEVADVNVVLDGNDFELPNGWPVFTPKNPRFFHDPGLVRDIDVSLVGEVRYLSQRKAIAERLAHESRIPVRLFGTSAADTGRTLSIAEYARLYQRSRISLAMTKDSVRQLKGRVFEILHCGAMLLCDRNHHVSHYLQPGVEYETYGDYEELVQKARWFLDHEDERAAIAAAGHRRAVSHYGHDTFWRSLLARIAAAQTGDDGRRNP